MLTFHDINCYIGKRGAPNPGSFHSTETLKEKMALCGIRKSLVWHTAALEMHPKEGNEEILRISRHDKDILPLWVVMPNHTGEFFDPEELVTKMLDNGVQAAKLFPKYNVLSYSLEEWSCGELLEALEDARIPVLVDIDNTDWNTLHGICTRHPELKLIVTNVYYRNGRYFYPLVLRHPNLYIEISYYKNFGGIEDMCRRLGADRLLFGTHMPFFDPGPAVSMVLYADISQEERELIAYRNFTRLLER